MERRCCVAVRVLQAYKSYKTIVVEVCYAAGIISVQTR